MKKQTSVYPPHKITALFCRVSLFSPVPAVLVRNLVQHQETQQQTEVSHSSVGSQEDLSAAEQNLTSVSSGSVYSSVTSLDQNLTLQESDSCLYVTMDIPSGEFNANTRRFFWDLVRVIQIPDIWNSYTSMSFTFMSGDDMANVGISGYSNVYSFNATHINIMQDQDKNSIFDQFYMAVLGARDLSVAQDKSLYEMAGKIWHKWLFTSRRLPLWLLLGYVQLSVQCWLFSKRHRYFSTSICRKHQTMRCSVCTRTYCCR